MITVVHNHLPDRSRVENTILMIPAGERQNFPLSALLLLYIAERAVVGAIVSQGLALVSERQPQTLFLRVPMHRGHVAQARCSMKVRIQAAAIHFV